MKPKTIAAKVGAVTAGPAFAWAVAALLVFIAPGPAGEDAGQAQPEQAQRAPATDTASPAIDSLRQLVLARKAQGCEASAQDCFNLWNACEPITLFANLVSPDPFLVRSDGRESGEMVSFEDVEGAAERRLRRRGVFRSREGAERLWVNVKFDTEPGFVSPLRSDKFTVQLSFAKRRLHDAYGNTGIGVTWSTEVSRDHGGSRTRILDAVRLVVDEFMNDYRRVNGPACEAR